MQWLRPAGSRHGVKPKLLLVVGARLCTMERLFGEPVRNVSPEQWT